LPRSPALLLWLTGGLAIGALRATNTWDWPTYLVIGGLAVVFATWRENGRFSLATLLQSAARLALLGGLATITFWPFADHYGTAYSSVSLWPGSYTYLGNYLSIYGLFLLFVVTYLAVELRAWARGLTFHGLRRLEPHGWLLVAAPLAFLGLLVVALLRGYWIAPVVLTLLTIAGLLGLQPRLPAPRRVALILLASALGLTLAVEIVVLDGDIGRMNTVFKFYLQVWTLLSVVAGAAAVWAWPALQRRGRPVRRAWQIALGLLLFAALLYPVTATRAKWAIRMDHAAPNTLDGMAFMQTVSYNDRGQTVALAYDYDAIQWMYRHIQGSPVIVEANDGTAYRSIGSRVAIYTGLPSVVGWDWHQRQQRSTVPGWLVSNRANDVNAFYNTTSVPEALAFLARYDVAYVYAGQLEWLYYSPDGMRKFDDMVQAGYLEEVYRNRGTSIYRVLTTGDAAQAAAPAPPTARTD
ncbi:MAG: hypothetical protein KC425_25740, partial [Anaerolineales bacterium]|nr:hypothetical protein [Anaerolineales bacterium]